LSPKPRVAERGPPGDVGRAGLDTDDKPQGNGIAATADDAQDYAKDGEAHSIKSPVGSWHHT